MTVPAKKPVKPVGTHAEVAIGPEHAECDLCSLRRACNGYMHPKTGKLVEGRVVRGLRPHNWRPGGMMIVAEHPTSIDVGRARGFVSNGALLLKKLCAEAGFDMDDCWLTYAVMGAPSDLKKVKSAKEELLDAKEAMPSAIYGCLPRLDEEIALAQPRVIVTLGDAALEALTGYEVEKTKNVKFDCLLRDNAGQAMQDDDGAPLYNCDADRKVGPAMACALGDCSWMRLAPPQARGWEPAQLAEWGAQVVAECGGECPTCKSSIKRVKPKRVKCPICSGKKMRQEKHVEYRCDHTLVGREGVAGAVFRAEELGPLAELGVKYVIPTYAPYFLTKIVKAGVGGKYMAGGQYAARVAMEHLKKAHKLLDRDALFEVRHTTTEGLTDAAAAKMVRDFVGAGGRFISDIETDRYEGPWGVTNINCIGIGRPGSPDVLVVDTRHVGGDLHEGNPLVEALGWFIESPDHHITWHNGTYDQVVIWRMWDFRAPPGTSGDTMMQHTALYPDEEHGLGFVAHELSDAPSWKAGHQKPREGAACVLSGYDTFDDLALYNARDIVSTGLVDTTMYNGGVGGRLAADKVQHVYEHDMELQEIAIAMELYGLPLSVDALGDIHKSAWGEAVKHLTNMREFVGDVPQGVCKPAEWEEYGGKVPFDPANTKHLDWALFDPLGPLRLQPLVITADKKRSTAKDVLLKYVDREFVVDLLAWRRHTYAISHYITSSSLVPANDGRIHPTWKVTGARTGRWSGSPNFMNWPLYMRAGVVAGPGRRLVGADYGQVELRVVASLSGDAELIRRCANAVESRKLEPDYDPHSYVASLAFGTAYTDLLLKDPAHYKAGAGQAACRCQTCTRSAIRTIVKRVVYGLNYGAGAKTILEAIYDGGYEGPPIKLATIERTIHTYFRAFPGVPRWRDATLKKAERDFAIYSPLLGRHRIFPLGQVDATVAWNYPIQSGAADIINMRMKILYKALPLIDPTAGIIAQVHDAIYVECAEEHVEAVKRCVAESLSVTLALVEGAAPMPYEAVAHDGQSWLEVA